MASVVLDSTAALFEAISRSEGKLFLVHIPILSYLFVPLSLIAYLKPLPKAASEAMKALHTHLRIH
jgi:hypothetical protein